MFRSLLIANRGEIACRIARTARAMGLRVIAVYSDADANAAHVALADTAVRIGPPPVRESYLRTEAVLEAARVAEAEAIHPGYGFLSENPDFAEACTAAGLIFVGPAASSMRAMGLKDRAKNLMQAAGIPVVPGYQGAGQEDADLASEAAKLGYPVLVKAIAGGGGKGMRLVERPSDFGAALASARREAASSFGNDRVLIEKYVERPRHIEVQVFADRHGHIIHLLERDCSVQRRHQKVIEEAPAPGMTEGFRKHVGAIAVQAARAVAYEGAGTIEFIADASEGLRQDRVWFMEMNTRLQVEHPVTEAITGIDLVEWQLRIAAGETLPCAQKDITPCGHAIEARLYAEDPQHNFLPSTGILEHLVLPLNVRVDSGLREGDAVTSFYDPMITKIVAHAVSREAAVAKLTNALSAAEIAGVRTNNAFLIRVLSHPEFVQGGVDTHFIERHFDTLLRPSTISDAVIEAAAACVAPVPSGKGTDPWSIPDSFRLAGRARRIVEFIAEGRRFTVPLPTSVQNDLRTVRLRNGDIAVIDHGETITLRPHDPLADADAEESKADSVTAPMPGKITQVLVKPDDIVRRGQPLVIIEAMKMEHTLSAPRDAVIEAIEVEVGAQAVEGAVLIRFGVEQ
ncbi:MAG: ATP-grasp domain-containing protein [Alphaproteobacteria bacterium]|nr:ATP-grasp domain-containing protein [Alphaproteobacteria bacterium]